MTKAQFLDTLRRRLAGLPPDEIDELAAILDRSLGAVLEETSGRR